MASPVISVRNLLVSESDGVADFAVILSEASASPVTVSYNTGNATAANGSDFTAASGTLTFAPGTTVQHVLVPIIDNAVAEPTESFFFNLFTPTNAAIGNTSAVATIVDNDGVSGTPVMSVRDQVVDEAAGTATFAVVLDRPSVSAVTVSYTTAAGTAGAADFSPVSGTLAFAPGDVVQLVTVPITNDAAAEQNETFDLVLSSAVGATLPDPRATALIAANDQPAVVTPVISVANLVVGESDGFAEFVVRLSAPSANTVSVAYNNANQTAANGSDYTAVSGTLTFAPGETTKTVRIPITNDTVAERNESLLVNLFSPVNAVLGNTEAEVSIIDNDATSGTPVMAVGDRVVDESAGVVSFVVTLDRPSAGTVTASYTTANGTAGAADFTATSGTVAFAPGETAKTITVPITNDALAEADETFDLVLSSPTGATLPDPKATALIAANDQLAATTPIISVADVVVGESDAFAEFVVRLSAPSAGTVTVSYNNANQTAANGSDYVAASGTLTFAPGETVKSVRVPIINDVLVENKEDFLFNLFSPTGGVIGNSSATATIIDNDAASGTPVMSIGDRVVDEAAGVVAFVVTLDRPSSGTVTASYTTAAGTAGAADFRPTNGVVAFAPGETAKTIFVPIINDTVAEGDEKFDLVLSAPVGATLPDPRGTAVIVGNDQTAVALPVISVANAVVGESDGYAEFVVRLNAPSASVVTVSYNDANQTAANGSDYVAVSGTLNFAPGETVKTVRVPIINDTAVESKEDFLLNLFSPVNAAIGNTSAVATIIDNDAPSGTPLMSIGDKVVDETAGLVTFTVTLDRPSTATVTANYATAAGTASTADFTPASGTLAFAPGETVKTVSVPITDDALAEGIETFDLVLSAAVGATLPDPRGTALIGANDQPTAAVPVVSVADVVAGESDGYAQFVVRLSAPSASQVTVSYNDANATAANGSDYVAVSGTLNFAPGETVKTVLVPIIDDTTAESKEDFLFNLFSPVNAAIGNSGALATIIDNDAASGTPIIAVGDPIVDETAGTATFAVTLDRPSTGTVTMNYATVAGTAGTTDYTPVTGTLAFGPGETAKTVVVPIADDALAEGDEKFDLLLSAPVGGTLPDARGTALIDASDQPTVAVPVISVANIVAGESDGYARFVVRLNAPSAGTVTVSYNNANATAATGSDYVAVSGTLNFAPGETEKTVLVPIINDTTAELKEDFLLNLFSPVNAVIGNTSAMATIVDNDATSGTPVIAIDDPVVNESSRVATFAVSLDRPSTGTVTVNYATAAGTAGAADFTAVTGTLAFAPGETVKTVTVPLTDDTLAEGDERFDLVLSAPVGATLPDPRGTALIAASDQPVAATPGISVVPVVAGEADGFAEFVVRLSAPSASAVSVSYNDANSTALTGSDYVAVSGTLTFAPGETAKAVRVPIINDAVAEF